MAALAAARDSDRRRIVVENRAMKKLFAVREYPISVDAAFLFVRLVVGAAFMFHGWGKMQNPMGWMGPDVPGILQAMAALSEFGGGLLLILGLLTRAGAAAIAATMTVAVLMHMAVMKDPFVHPTGGRSYELALTFLSIAVLFVLAGPGRYSLDRKIFGRH